MEKGALTQRTIVALIIVLCIFVLVTVAVIKIFNDVFNTEISKGESSLEGDVMECETNGDCPEGQICEDGICIGEAETEGFLYVTEG